MKMGIFKKSGLTNCDKILKFANFENGGGGGGRYRYSAGHTACYVKILPISLLLMVKDMFAYF